MPEKILFRLLRFSVFQLVYFPVKIYKIQEEAQHNYYYYGHHNVDLAITIHEICWLFSGMVHILRVTGDDVQRQEHKKYDLLEIRHRLIFFLYK